MMNSGYARTTEFQADKGAVDILKKSGYDPAALVGMLQEMQKRWVPNGPGFGHTHPEPSVRIAEVQKTDRRRDHGGRAVRPHQSLQGNDGRGLKSSSDLTHCMYSWR